MYLCPSYKEIGGHCRDEEESVEVKIIKIVRVVLESYMCFLGALNDLWAYISTNVLFIFSTPIINFLYFFFVSTYLVLSFWIGQYPESFLHEHLDKEYNYIREEMQVQFC